MSDIYIDHIRFKEFCDGDISTLDCLEFINLENHDILPNIYHASRVTTSNGNIADNNVEFNAGESISLEPGFETQSGIQFLAQIVGCP